MFILSGPSQSKNIYIYVTHSHKTQDKSLIKKNKIYICLVVDQYPVLILMKKLTLCDLHKKDIAVLVYGTE